MPRHTKLKLLNGRTLCEWIDGEAGWDSRLAIWFKARSEIADMINAPLYLIEEIQDEDGEFFGFDGEKLGYLVHDTVESVPPAFSTISAVDLRPLLARA